MTGSIKKIQNTSPSKKTVAKKSPPEIRFKENVVYLFRVLKNVIIKAKKRGYDGLIKPSFLEMGINVIMYYDPDVIIQTFIGKSYNFWKAIDSDDQNIQNGFIKEHGDVIFAGPVSEVLDIKAVTAEIFDTKLKDGNQMVLDKERGTIFRTLTSCVTICVNYLDDNDGHYKTLMNDFQIESTILRTCVAEARERRSNKDK